MNGWFQWERCKAVKVLRDSLVGHRGHGLANALSFQSGFEMPELGDQVFIDLG